MCADCAGFQSPVASPDSPASRVNGGPLVKLGYIDDGTGACIAVVIVDETISGCYVCRRPGGALYYGQSVFLVKKDRVEDVDGD